VTLKVRGTIEFAFWDEIREEVKERFAAVE
jgi:hypothetical protein